MKIHIKSKDYEFELDLTEDDINYLRQHENEIYKKVFKMLNEQISFKLHISNLR